MDRLEQVAAGLLIVAMLLTLTRSAWLAGALVFVLALARTPRWRRAARLVPARWLLTAGASLVLGVGAVTLFQGVGEGTLLWKVLHITDFSEGTGRYRVEIYDWAIDDMRANESWALGNGTNSFSQFHELDPTAVGVPYLSSLWLGLLFDVGILGLVTFMAFAVLTLLRATDRWGAAMVWGSLALCASTTNIIWFAYAWCGASLVTYRMSTVVVAPRSQLSTRDSRDTPH